MGRHIGGVCIIRDANLFNRCLETELHSCRRNLEFLGRNLDDISPVFRLPRRRSYWKSHHGLDLQHSLHSGEPTNLLKATVL